MIYTTTYQSPIGLLTLAADEKGITGLWIENQKYFASGLQQGTKKENSFPILKAAKSWLDRYFKGEKPLPQELPLNPSGSPFRQAVWQILCTIPYGQTMTYGEIAKQLTAKFPGKKTSARAVGGAVGHNPISIIIPCHRVVGTNHSLTGYAGGIQNKIKLLKHEGVNMDKFWVPKKGTAL
jgi:methylated-DNA-[protein]-cysteine S-methyltransferase